MSLRLNITAAGNTYNPCLIILRHKGYKLSADLSDDGSKSIYCAEKDGMTFSGYSPPELLGIVILGEEFGNDWNQQTPDVLAQMLSDESKS